MDTMCTDDQREIINVVYKGHYLTREKYCLIIASNCRERNISLIYLKSRYNTYLEAVIAI